MLQVPGLQVNPHWPLTHVADPCAGLVQMLPHAPQLAMVVMLVHLPLQTACPWP
jgi:hypothetical protein